jgi:glutathione S-transferase
MSCILIGSLTSPYVRKIRLCLHDVIPYELKTVNYLEQNDAAYLKSINPINKIPILIDEKQTIYDSRVIYNYLAKKYDWTPLTLNEENILSAIDAALDTSINLFSLKRGGLDTSKPNTYVTRQEERIPLLLNYLSLWAVNCKEWNFLSMSLYSYLDWASFRELLKLSEYPEMQKFLERFKDAKGVQATKIVVS